MWSVYRIAGDTLDSGWVKLHRKIRDHWIWQDPNYLKWWIDLLMLVNHSPAKVLINGKPILIQRGMYHTSETKLSERWYIDRRTVSRFLKMLESDDMITVNKRRQDGTTVKVNNYAAYQGVFDGDMHNEMDNGIHNESASKAHQNVHKQELNNNKNSKNEKNSNIGGLRPPAPTSKKFIIPTVEEITAYCADRHNGIDAEHFHDHYTARGWILSNGKKMVDWKASVRTWEKNERERGRPNGNSNGYTSKDARTAVPQYGTVL